MASKRKTWAEKMSHPAAPSVQILDKSYAGNPAGARMLIPTPAIVKEYIESIPAGEVRTMPQMRADLAKQFEADMTCPLTAGIFTRIVAEASLESGADKLVPFWRLVDPKSPLGKKMSCGAEFLAERREAEIR